MTTTDTITFDVVFERIGRGCRGVTESFVVNAADAADELAFAVFNYARRHLASSGYDVTVDLGVGTGSIEYGRFGKFTLTERTA